MKIASKSRLFISFAVTGIIFGTSASALAENNLVSKAIAEPLVSVVSANLNSKIYFSSLDPTAHALLLPAVRALTIFQNEEKLPAYESHCQLLLNQNSIQATCESSNDARRLKVLEQGASGTHTSCFPEIDDGCGNFITQCRNVDGNPYAIKNGSFACHFSNFEYQTTKEKWIELISTYQSSSNTTQHACAMQSGIDQLTANEGGDNIETHDVVNHCFDVYDCNDMISQCIVYGGDFTPDSFDPDSGAPSTGTCVTKNDDC